MEAETSDIYYDVLYHTPINLSSKTVVKYRLEIETRLKAFCHIFIDFFERFRHDDHARRPTDREKDRSFH